MSPHPIAPPWLVLPLGAITLIVIAGYLTALRAAPESDALPASRRRIRLLSGWISMITVALLAYGFGVATPAQTRTFMLTWVAATAMVGLVLVLAMIDLGDTYRIRRAEQRARMRELADARREALRGAGRSHPGPLSLSHHPEPDDDR